MAKKSQGGKTSRRGSISEGSVKKGSVNTTPTTSRPSKPAGQGGSSSGNRKKK
jgi:hypothetical protein